MQRALIISGYGINSEQETMEAWKMAGASAEIVHLNDILSRKYSILDYDSLTFPGGFSFGDELGSGKILANLLKSARLSNDKMFFGELLKFLEAGKFILGICNGFQVLVQCGLLPDILGKQQPEATLAANACGHFEDRWVNLTVNKEAKIALWKEKGSGNLPIRHGEGRLVFVNEEVRQTVLERNLNILSYADKNCNPTHLYPENPNGSELNCAALLHPSGQILGLMPHPEAFLSSYNHPEWPQWQDVRDGTSSKTHPISGLEFFKDILLHMERKR